MASIKLTESIRESILQEILAHRFHEELEAICTRRATLARDLLETQLSTTDWERIGRLPEGWVGSISAFRAQLAGCWDDLHLSGWGLSGDLLLAKRTEFRYPRVERRVPVSFCKGYGCLLTLAWGDSEDGDALLRRHEALANELKQIEAMIKAAKSSTKAALAKATTLAKLEHLWPEVAAFTARHHKTKPQLPSVPVAQLNSMLKLPKEEAA